MHFAPTTISSAIVAQRWAPASRRSSAMAFVFLLLVLLPSASGFIEQPRTPPRGWNSYDSYSWVISEDQFLENAKIVSEKLLPFGYEYVVVDFLWYRRKEAGASVTTPGFDNIDEWGRPIPDPSRWPSSRNGLGFKLIADQVHAMGLKFGIHVMRGISTQAVEENTPVFGKKNQTWRARDIALEHQSCSWMSQCFVSVNESTEGGRAFIQSLYDLYASWEVDFVKHDCVFGVYDLRIEEIYSVSKAIVATGRPMLYSISPGVRADVSMATLIHNVVNMYRVTGDDWDSWQDLHSHFDVARDFAAAGLIGATGLDGFAWPDLDMLPLGYLTDPGANHGPDRFSRLSLEEQRTQMTLWAMAKSPLMFGGDMIMKDNTTIDLLTNPVVLEINANSYGNMEVQISNATAAHHTPSLSLVDCQGAKDTFWSLKFSGAPENHAHLCWKHMIFGDGCLHWDSLSTSTARVRTRVMQQGGFSMDPSGRVVIHRNSKNCLDARVNRFSLCSQERNQIWHAKLDGKLVSNSSKLCAVVDGLTNEPRGATDTRIWMARGREGEYYVGLFNMKEQPVDVFVPVSGLVEAGLQISYKRQNIEQAKNKGFTWSEYECRGQEAWSMDDIGTVKGVLHTKLAPHGCALFSLLCNFLKEVSNDSTGVSSEW